MLAQADDKPGGLDPAVTVATEGFSTSPPRSRWRGVRALELFIPAALLTVVVGASVLVPALGLPDPNRQDLRRTGRNLGLFSDGHLLGTDSLGRDLLSRALHGARVSLMVGLFAVVIGLTIGGLIGMIAGYKRGVVDTVLMRVIEMIMAFPALVLALTIAAYLGPSVRNVIIAISFFTIPAYARIARAATLSLREREFILSSELLGAKTPHVVFGHLAPNVVIPLLAYAFVAIGTAIIVEASLSFLGLGIRPPNPSWGIMIAQGRGELEEGPHQALVPGAFLFVTVLSLNLLGDAVRSRLNRSRGKF